MKTCIWKNTSKNGKNNTGYLWFSKFYHSVKIQQPKLLLKEKNNLKATDFIDYYEEITTQREKTIASILTRKKLLNGRAKFLFFQMIWRVFWVVGRAEVRILVISIVKMRWLVDCAHFKIVIWFFWYSNL
jgi:hypothetical protein